MSVSAPTAAPNVELADILAGGAPFMARLKQLEDKKAAVEAVLATLREAQAAAAEKAIADARAEAERIVAEANATATGIIAKAEAREAQFRAAHRDLLDTIDGILAEP